MRVVDSRAPSLVATACVLFTVTCARQHAGIAPASILPLQAELALYEAVLRASDSSSDSASAPRLNTQIDRGSLSSIASAGRRDLPVVGRLEQLPDDWTSRLVREHVIRGICHGDPCHRIAYTATFTPPRSDSSGRVVVVISWSGSGLCEYAITRRGRSWSVEGARWIAIY